MNDKNRRFFMQTNLEAIKLMNSTGFEEEIKESPAPMVAKPQMGLQATGHDLNQKIINKIFSLSKAISDEFGLDQRAVMEDIFKDLRIAGGEEILDVIKGDTPIEQITKEMAQAAKGMGLDSNLALNALLQINEKDYVEAFRQYISRNQRQLPNFGGAGRIAQRQRPAGTLPDMPESIMERLSHRVLLDEGLNEIHTQYYSDIKREQFDKLIALDPTFNAEEDKLGTYGKWIINAFKQKRLKERDFGRVNEILFDFNDRKRFINPADMRDINKYKTLDEIRTALDNIQLTANQIAKQARKAKQHADLGEEAEFISENDEWEIWSPKTYAASCKLGSGTTWCTASTSYRGYFDSYTNSGKLYIFYPKSGDTTKKFQAHVKNGDEVTTFMDANDRPSIDFSLFIHQQKLLSALKNSELKNLKQINEIENMERLEKGEPYVYTSGKMPSNLAPLVKTIIFKKDHEGEKLEGNAFKGCTSLEVVYLHENITYISLGAFRGCSDKAKIYTLKRDTPIDVFSLDIPYLQGRIKYIPKEKMIYA
jgi:hypothetical protein